jgi:hypothetical protein
MPIYSIKLCVSARFTSRMRSLLYDYDTVLVRTMRAPDVTRTTILRFRPSSFATVDWAPESMGSGVVKVVVSDTDGFGIVVRRCRNKEESSEDIE